MYLRAIYLTLLALTGLWSTNAQTDERATDVIIRADEKMRGKSSESLITMVIERPTWSRTISFKNWSKGNEYALIVITAPAKDKGQVFLKRGKEMWHWVPSIERIVKIPPSMMMQGWMGSDYTNDDLVRESSVVRDYFHRYLAREKCNEIMCHKIELIPKPDAPVVWGKIIAWVSEKDGFFVRSEYYDEDFEKINTETASEFNTLGGRYIPTKFELVPANKQGHRTLMQIEHIVFDKNIPDDFFSLRNAKMIKP